MAILLKLRTKGAKMQPVTTTSIKNSKGEKKLVMITAYDALFAKLLASSADILLVGDSLANSFAGSDDTLGVTLEEMIYHTKAVTKGAPNSFVVMDMPFGSIQTPHIALQNATKAYKETKATAVKIEGGVEKAETIKLLTENGIAVMGHIGLMPQFVRSDGGYKIKGKDEMSAEKLLQDAKAVESAGAFAIVLEGVKSSVADLITKEIAIPTIGIGAGSKTDGQVLVWSDLFGFFEGFKPKFVRRYLDGADLIRSGAKAFAEDVKNGKFPDSSEQYQ